MRFFQENTGFVLDSAYEMLYKKSVARKLAINFILTLTAFITMENTFHPFSEKQKTWGDCHPYKEFDPSVYQYYPDTCAIQSQKIVLEKFGIHKTQEELIEQAKLNGWYVEGQGTPMQDVGKLLEYHGIPFESSTNNNIFTLAHELAQHRQVIVAVDEGELVERLGVFGDISDWFMGETPNHALVVTGLDTSNPDDVRVVLTDPGTGELCVEYSEQEFMSAWADSNFMMTSTTISPEEHLALEYVPETSFAGFTPDELQALGGGDLSDYSMADILETIAQVARGVVVVTTVLAPFLAGRSVVEGPTSDDNQLPPVDDGHIDALDDGDFDV